MTPKAHSINLIGISADFLASPGFNETAARIEIPGVREFNPELFSMLADAESLEEAERAFTLYMNALFAIDVEQASSNISSPFRSSYLKLLQGWGFDSNSPEGAVIKGWVESRFGLAPNYHKHPLSRGDPEASTCYLKEKMDSRFHGNSIYSQLDLLFEFCQHILRRFLYAECSHVTLYRGLNAPEVKNFNRKSASLVSLNNIVSTSIDRDVAGCFGDIIVEIRAPISKILFVNGLLSIRPLRGEGEVLLIGGDYWVTPQT
jgi:NAD+--dinitrogen-reductase ADP-D-ribosyltransferase